MRLFLFACGGVLVGCSSSPSGPSVRQESPSKIVAGDASTCLLSTAGKAYCWGADSTDFLGIGSAVTAQLNPAAVVGGQIYTAISGAEVFRCALSNGEPWCWGQTLSGEHGEHFATDTTPTMVAAAARLATITVGPDHACGLTANGAAYCWGENYLGQLGAGDTLAHAGMVAVAGGMRFLAISTGFWHTCALTSSGAAYCWGENAAGELGFPPATGAGPQIVTSPQAVSGGLKFASISAGTVYTCAVTSAGAAYCWGLNVFGNLGDGTDTTRMTPTAVVQPGETFTAVSVFTGNRVTGTTCGITTSGAAYCWGYNGALGNPTVIGKASYIPVPVSGGLTFATLSIGATHVCGITTSSAAYCWGSNDHGQLGDGTTQPSVVPIAVTGGLTASLTRRAWR